MKSVFNRAALQLCMQRNIVVRGLKFSAVVGTILVAINQWDVLLAGEITAQVGLKILLTYSVPYVVSTLSSVQALRQQ
jgi:hypothetical protein